MDQVSLWLLYDRMNMFSWHSLWVNNLPPRLAELIGPGRASVRHSRSLGATYDSDLVQLLAIQKSNNELTVMVSNEQPQKMHKDG